MESTLELTKCGSGLSWKKLGKMLNDERPTLKVGKSGLKGFSGASAVKNPLAMQEQKEMQVPPLDQEDPLEQEMATHFQYSCLENPKDRGAWGTTVHGVTKNQTRLEQLGTYTQGRSEVWAEAWGARAGGHKWWELSLTGPTPGSESGDLALVRLMAGGPSSIPVKPGGGEPRDKSLLVSKGNGLGSKIYGTYSSAGKGTVQSYYLNYIQA